MNAKKNPRFDLERKRVLFFQLGMMITGSLTLAAFTYQDPMTKADVGLAVTSETVDYQVEEIIKPDDAKPDDSNDQQDQTTTTINDQQTASELINQTVNSRTTVDPNAGVSTGELPIGPEFTIGNTLIPVTPEDHIEEYPKVEASFIGGFAALQRYIQQNVDYPDISMQIGEKGTVYLNFVVEKDGSISNIVVERGISPELDREAKRLLRNSPKWKPGESQYEKVRSRARMPITFELE